MYAITLHQPWASLVAQGVKTIETRSWPAPARLIGQTIAIHAGKRVVRQPSVPIEEELQARLGEEWRRTLPAGAVLATAVLAGMARVATSTYWRARCWPRRRPGRHGQGGARRLGASRR